MSWKEIVANNVPYAEVTPSAGGGSNAAGRGGNPYENAAKAYMVGSSDLNGYVMDSWMEKDLQSGNNQALTQAYEDALARFMPGDELSFDNFDDQYNQWWTDYQSLYGGYKDAFLDNWSDEAAVEAYNSENLEKALQLQARYQELSNFWNSATEANAAKNGGMYFNQDALNALNGAYEDIMGSVAGMGHGEAMDEGQWYYFKNKSDGVSMGDWLKQAQEEAAKRQKTWDYWEGRAKEGPLSDYDQKYYDWAKEENEKAQRQLGYASQWGMYDSKKGTSEEDLIPYLWEKPAGVSDEEWLATAQNGVKDAQQNADSIQARINEIDQQLKMLNNPGMYDVTTMNLMGLPGDKEALQAEKAQLELEKQAADKAVKDAQAQMGIAQAYDGARRAIEEHDARQAAANAKTMWISPYTQVNVNVDAPDVGYGNIALDIQDQLKDVEAEWLDVKRQLDGLGVDTWTEDDLQLEIQRLAAAEGPAPDWETPDQTQDRLRQQAEANLQQQRGTDTEARRAELTAKMDELAQQGMALQSQFDYAQAQAINDRDFMEAVQRGELAIDQFTDKFREQYIDNDAASEQILSNYAEMAKTDAMYLGAENLFNVGDAYAESRREKNLADVSIGEDWTEDEANWYRYLMGQGKQDEAFAYAETTNRRYNQAALQKDVAGQTAFGTGTGRYYIDENGNRVKNEDYGFGDWLGNMGRGAWGYVTSAANMPVAFADWMDKIATVALSESAFDGNGYYAGRRDAWASDRSNARVAGRAEQLNLDSGTFNDNLAVIGGKGLGDLYQLGNSMFQSFVLGNGMTTGLMRIGGLEQAVAAEIAEVGTLALFFGQAANSAFDEAINRGANANQAAYISALSGVAEVAGEKISLENLLDSKNWLGSWWKSLLAQGGIEGSEEAFTDVLNQFGDSIAAQLTGGQTDMEHKLADLMSTGMSYSEASKKLWRDAAMDAAFDFVGGFISGGFSGQGQYMLNAGARAAAKGAEAVYGQMNYKGKGMNSTEAMLTEAKAKGGEAAKLAGELEGKRMTNKRAQGLYEALENADKATIRQAVNEQLQRDSSLTGDKLTEMTDAAMAYAMGNATKEQLDLLNGSETAKQVLYELQYGENEKGLTSWSRDLNVTRVRPGSVADKIQDIEASENLPSRFSRDLEVNGEKLSISGITEHGLVQAKNSKGETVDVKMSDLTPEQKQVIRYMKDNFGDRAGEMLRTIEAADTNLTTGGLANIAKAANVVWTVSQNSSLAFDENMIRRNIPGHAQIFDSTALRTIWDIARQTTEQKQRRKAEGPDTTKYRNAVNGVVFYADGHRFEGFEIGSKDLTDQQKGIIRMAEVMSRLSNGRLRFNFYHGGDYGIYGAYQNGVIHLDMDHVDKAGNSLVTLTMAHELTHFIESFNQADYAKLRDFVIDHLMQSEDVTLAELIEKKQARQPGLSKTGAISEIVADGCEMMLQDGSIIKDLAEMDGSLFGKVARFVTNLLGEMKRAIGMAPARTAESKALLKHIDEMLKLWNNALKGALESEQGYVTEEYYSREDTSEIRGTRQQRMERAVQQAKDEGVGEFINAEGQTVGVIGANSRMQFSMDTYRKGGRSTLEAYLRGQVNDKQLTKEDAAEMLKQVDEIYKICDEYDKSGKYAPFSAWSHASVVTYDGRPVFSVIKQNGEYKLNLDFSLVCKKRRTLDAVFNEMIRQGIMDDFQMFQESIAKINDIIRENDFEVACGLCFVDSKRYRQAMIADAFTMMYNKQVFSLVKKGSGQKLDYFNYGGNETLTNSGAGIDTLADEELNWTAIDKILAGTKTKTVEYKIARYLKDNPSARKLVQRGDFMSTAGFDALKAQNPELLSLYNSKKGAGGPKAAQSDVQYLNDIIQNGAFNQKAAYEVGGVRIQSFSDYVGRLCFDYVQMVADLAAKQLPAHSYTKEYLFAQQFGLTGIKINMSLVPDVVKGAPAGLDKDGNYVWKDGQSFGSTVYVNKGKRMTAAEGFELAKRIQNAPGYSRNCGTIAVGVSDEHILKMLDDADIRMIIPYHKSSLNHIVAVMNNIDKYEDYTLQQSTRKKKDGKWVKLSASEEFNFNEALQRLGDAKAAANEYLAWCKENGYLPKFDHTKGGHNFSEHENYYKLLEDFSCYDTDGVTNTPLSAVQTVFPTATDAFGSMSKLIKEGLEEDTDLQARQDAAVPDIVKQIQSVLPAFEEGVKQGKKKGAAKATQKQQLSREDTQQSGRILFSRQDASSKEAEAIKKQIEAHSDELNKMDPVFVKNGIKPKNTHDTYLEGVQEFKKIGYKVDRKGFGIIDLSPKVFNTALDYANTAAERAALLAVPRVLKRGIEIKELSEHKSRNHDTITFGGPVVLNGKRGNMAVVVKKTTSLFYKTHRILMPDNTVYILAEESEDAAPTPARGATENGPLSKPISSASKKIIAEENEKIKSEPGKKQLSREDVDYDAAVRAGDMERAQRMVDQAAERAGYNRRAYHGTVSQFWTFRRGIQGIHFGTLEQAEQTLEKDRARHSSTKYTISYLRENLERLSEGQLEGLIDDLATLAWSGYDNIPTFDWSQDITAKTVRAYMDQILKQHPKAAEEKISSAPINNEFQDRMIDAYVRMQHPIVIPADLTDWTSWNIASVLLKKLNGEKAEAGRYHRGMAESERITWDPADITGIELTEADRATLEKIATTYRDDFQELVDFLHSKGVDSIEYTNMYEGSEDAPSYLLLDPEQIKLADPVTYDDKGEVIPLSERFNAEKGDMRFSREDIEGQTSLWGDAEQRRMHTQIRERVEAAEQVRTDVQAFFRNVSEESENFLDADEIEEALAYDPHGNRELGDMYDADAVLESLSGIAAENGGKTRTQAFDLMDRLLEHVSPAVANSWIGEGSQDADFAEWYEGRHPSLYYEGYQTGDLNFRTGKNQGTTIGNIVKEIAHLKRLLARGSLPATDRAEAQRLLDQLNESMGGKRNYFYSREDVDPKELKRRLAESEKARGRLEKALQTARKQAEYWKAETELPGKKGVVKANPKDVAKFVRAILKEYQYATVKPEELTARVQQIADGFMNAEDPAELYRIAYDVARDIINSSYMRVNDEMELVGFDVQTTADKVKADLKGYIYVAKQDHNDIAAQFGLPWETIEKKFRKYGIKLTSDLSKANKGGLRTIDSLYSEFAPYYGWDLNELSLAKMLETFDLAMDEEVANPYYDSRSELSRVDVDFIAELAEEIFEGAISEQVRQYYTRAEQVEKKGDRALARMGEKLQTAREKQAEIKAAGKDKLAAQREKDKAKLQRKLQEEKDKGAQALAAEKEKGRQAVIDTKIDYAARIRKLREQKNQRMQEIIQEERQKRRDLIRRNKETRERREVREKIWKLQREAQQMIDRPTPGAYVPANLMRAMADMLSVVSSAELRQQETRMERIDRRLEEMRMDEATHDKKAAYIQKAIDRLGDLQARYADIAKDPTYAYTYSEAVNGYLEQLKTYLYGTHLTDGDMDADTLRQVYNMMNAVMFAVKNANKLTAMEFTEGIRGFAKEFNTQMNHADAKRGLAGTMQETMMWQMRPDTFFSYLCGYAKGNVGTKIQKMFVEGTQRKLTLQRDFYNMFRDVTEAKSEADRKAYRQMTQDPMKELVSWGLTDSNGDEVFTSRGMMLQAYMLLEQEDSRRSLAIGGFRLPNLKEYYHGNTEAAYGKFSTLSENHIQEYGDLLAEARHLRESMEGMTEAQKMETEERIMQVLGKANQVLQDAMAHMDKIQQAIEEKLTDFDKRIILDAHQWYDYSGKKLDETNMKLYGFKKPRPKGYVPIHRDLTSVSSVDIRDMQNTVNLENAGFTKSRVKSTAPILLTDIFMELDNNQNKMSNFYGFVQVQRDFNAIWKCKVPGQNLTVEGKVAEKFGKGQKALTVSGQQYIENYIKSLVGGSHDVRLLSTLYGNAAAATLSLNPKVAVSQLASIPTAAAELGWAPVLKGLARGLKTGMSTKAKQELAQKDVWFWQRYRGEGGMREFAEIKNNRGTAIGRLWNRVASTKIGGILLNWCQDMDTLATASMWAMSEEYVKARGIDISTAEGQQAVSDAYRNVIRKTQPNYTATERSDLLRDKREAMKFLTMYKTQSNQNLNILIEATGEFSRMKRDFNAGKNGVTAADVKAATRKLANAYSAVVVGGALTYAALRTLASFLLGSLKAYRDDDDELTTESVLKGTMKEFASSLAGMDAFTGILYDVLYSSFSDEKYYGLSDNAMGALSDVLSGTVDMFQALRDDEKGNEWDAIHKQLKNLCTLAGIPLGNAEKFIDAARMWYNDLQNGTFGQFEGNVKRKPAQEAHRLLDAFRDGDTEKAAQLFQNLQDQQKGSTDWKREQQAQSFVKNKVKTWYVEDAELTEDQAREILVQYCGMTEREANELLREWKGILDNGYDYGDAKDAYISGDLSEDELMLYATTYMGLKGQDADDAVTNLRCEKDTGYSFNDLMQAYVDGAITEQEAIKYRMQYGGYTKDEATETVAKWRCEKETGVAFSKLEDAYVDGVISRQQAEAWLKKYGGVDTDKAQEKLLKWTCERDTGVKYNDIEEAYIAGKVTKQQVIAWEQKYGGHDKDKAEELLARYEFAKQTGVEWSQVHQGFKAGKLTEADLLRGYMQIAGMDREKAGEYVQVAIWKRDVDPEFTYEKYGKWQQGEAKLVAAGVPKTLFAQVAEAWANDPNLKTDYTPDGKQVTDSKMRKVLAYIGKLDIPAEQKDALAFSFYKEGKKIRKYKTW